MKEKLKCCCEGHFHKSYQLNGIHCRPCHEFNTLPVAKPKKTVKPKKVKRVVLGVGHPWFSSKEHGPEFNRISLWSEDGHGKLIGIDPKGIGGWNKIRLVAEVLK